MLKIGLTGGIGCGKSTVSQLFSSLGVSVIDADYIAHELVAPGQAALMEIITVFGKEVLKADGSLNRAKLRNLVFSERNCKNTLEKILHPLIYAEIDKRLSVIKEGYVVLSIPLLFETLQTHYVNRILVVDCLSDQQIMRVMQRDDMSRTVLNEILASQVNRDFRLAHADDVIDNTGSPDKLAQQVKKLHNLYVSLSSK